MIGADPEGSVHSGGTGRPHLVEGVGEDFGRPLRQWLRHRLGAVSDPDSFAMTRRLAEEALPVGGSCGGYGGCAPRRGRARARPRDVAAVWCRHPTGRAHLAKVFNDAWTGRLRLPAARPGTTSATCCAARTARPRFVHAHPNETVADAVHYLREFAVSQMPVVRAEPPVMAAEVAGSVSGARPAGRAVLPAARALGPAGAAHVAAAAHPRCERTPRHSDVGLGRRCRLGAVDGKPPAW